MSMQLSAGTTGAGGTTSLSRSFVTHAGGAVTAGWLLIAMVGTTNPQSSDTPPTGWTPGEMVTYSTGNGWAAWAWKIADGSEDTIAWSWGTAAAGSSFSILAYNDAVTTLDDSAEDESNISTVVTSQGSGTATATVANGLAIALFSPMDAGNLIDSGAAYSDSFVVDIQNFSAGNSRSGQFIASKVFSGTGNHSCTFTTSDTGDEMWGSIALFVTPGSAPVIQKRRMLMGVGA